MISILLPIYNGERYVSSSIESILNQTFKDFELLIAFNGTEDNSKQIVSNYNDPRIRIFDYGQDAGKAKTLNKLIREAKFDWLALQDDDDVWLPNKLQMQSIYTTECDVIGTFIEYINEDGRVTGRPTLASSSENIRNLSLSGTNQVANTSTIFKKSIALEVDGWKEGLDGIEDFDFWLRLMRLGKKFINIPEVLVQHRLHTRSSFNTKKYDLNKIL
jgi:glycosyltransferase involved in cell wall biosynthesis